MSRGEKPDELAQWLAQYHRFGAADLQPYLYTLPNEQAVRHAFRVASGLDSMVLGEPQILGQMKDAARAAEVGGHARQRAAPPVPALLRGGEGSALDHQHRRGQRLDGRGGGEARCAHLPEPQGPERAASSAPAR